MERRLNCFTNDEIYILSRQAIIASSEIVYEYDNESIEISNRLLNELILERKLRDIGLLGN